MKLFKGHEREKAPFKGKTGAPVLDKILGYLPGLWGIREGLGLSALSRQTKEVLWCRALGGLTCSMQSKMPPYIWLQFMHSCVLAGSNHTMMSMHANELEHNDAMVGVEITCLCSQSGVAMFLILISQEHHWHDTRPSSNSQSWQ